jgi:hypothetical protein
MISVGCVNDAHGCRAHGRSYQVGHDPSWDSVKNLITRGSQPSDERHQAASSHRSSRIQSIDSRIQVLRAGPRTGPRTVAPPPAAASAFALQTGRESWEPPPSLLLGLLAARGTSVQVQHPVGLLWARGTSTSVELRRIADQHIQQLAMLSHLGCHTKLTTSLCCLQFI